MPKVIIVNIPRMYHCLLCAKHVTHVCCLYCFNSLHSYVFTKAFNLDCPYIIYIIISVMIRVISAAVNISTSARELFMNDLNLNFLLGCLVLVLSCLEYSFCFCIELPNLTKFLEL